MGQIAIIRQTDRAKRNDVTITDITADPGGGADLTEEQFQPTGSDSQPLPGDYLIGVSIEASGGQTAVGFLDPVNAPKSGPGEDRSYSRSAEGVPVAEVWLKTDGTITINNDKCSVDLNADGSIAVKNDSGSLDLTTAGILELNGNSDNAVRFSVLNAGFNQLRTELNALVTAYNAAVYTIGGIGTTGTTSAPGAPAVAIIAAAKVDEVTVP